MKLDLVRTRYLKLDAIDFQALEQFIVSIEDQLGRELEASHVKNDGMITAIQNRYPYRFVRYADMRYVGQGFELTTRLPENLSTTTVDDIRAAFEHQYRLMFGTSIEGAPLEVLNWRVQAFAHQGQAILPIVNQAPSGGVTSARRRRAFFPCVRDWVETPVIAEQSLPVGQTQTGPALIEQAGSTVVVGPSDCYHKDRFGNIHIALATEAVS